MKAVALGVLTVLGSVGTLEASLLETHDLGWYTVDRLSGNGAPANEQAGGLRAVADGYRNWVAPSNLAGILTTGQNRFDGDDITLVPNGGNWLDDMGFSIANTNLTAGQNLTSMRVDFNFFTPDGVTNLGGFFSNLNLITLFGANGLPANNSARINFGAGGLAALNISLPNSFIVTTSFSNVIGIGGADPNLVGLQVRNPPATGSSADSLVLNGTITASPFSGAPVGNLSHFFSLNSVPTPGSLALFGVGGLLAARRRR